MNKRDIKKAIASFKIAMNENDVHMRCGDIKYYCIIENACATALEALHEQLKQSSETDREIELRAVKAELERYREKCKKLEWDLRSYELTHEKAIAEEE